MSIHDCGYWLIKLKIKMTSSSLSPSSYGIFASSSTTSTCVSQFQFSSPIGFIPFNFIHQQQQKLTFSHHYLKKSTRAAAAIDDKSQFSSNTPSLVVQEQENPNKEVEECVRLLKNAAKTRKVAPQEILSAFTVIEKAKLDPAGFFETLGGTESPGKTWMLIFTADKGLQSGKYFPITAIQRFDAAGKRIENGVYLGPLGCLTFEGRLSWNKRILAFIFERIRVKIGPFSPFEIGFNSKDEREPSNKEDPFFIWFYIDEEIAVARGRSGGTAFWVRCKRIS